VFYGPFRSRGSAELFESQMLDLFQIRRCQEDLMPSPEHPGCMYGEMNLCLRPCQQAVGVEEYATEVGRVVEFLESGGRSLVQPMQAARDRSSEAMEFEEAARLHKRLEKIEATLKLRDELVRPVDALDGVAVAGGIEPGTVSLWFMRQGVWQPVVRFAVQAESDRPVSMDTRLRTVASTLPPGTGAATERQEHVALLARWFYSSWRDGEWIPFAGPEGVPYRKLVGAVHRVAARSAVALS
jgi:excinuclease UvrABC nuclease subunit